METTHYDALNVTRDAAPEVIAAAYKALSRLHHPDLNANSPESTRRMVALNAAYQVLSHPEKRVLYNRQLHQRPQTGMSGVTVHAPPRAAKVAWPAKISRRHNDYPLPSRLGALVCLAACGMLFVLYDTALHLPPPSKEHERRFVTDDAASMRFGASWLGGNHSSPRRDLF